MLKHPILHNIPVFPKILLLIALIIFTLIFSIIFGTLIAVPFWGSDVLNKISSVESSSDPSIVAMAKYFQMVSQLGMFIFPVLIFAFLDGRKIGQYLKLNINPGFIICVLAGLSILTAAPLINYLAELNMQMKLPSSLAGVEQWMRNSEDQAAQLTTVFLDVKTIWGFLINILMIGILPAVGEEFLFRGVVQPLFHKWTKNVHVAVIISAFLFSAIHFQFYGFIPRFLMGILLGYSFAWTGSLWVPIMIHFINNTAAVIMSYLFMSGHTSNSYETIGTGENAALPVVVSVVVSATVIFIMHHLSKKKKHILAVYEKSPD
jgi:uncharacterized protein